MSSAASGISAMVHHGPFSLKDFDGALRESYSEIACYFIRGGVPQAHE